MANTKSTPKCTFDKCQRPRRASGSRGGWGRFCNFHREKVTISLFLQSVYRGISSRTKGKNTCRPDLYFGLPVMPKEVFFNWSKNHPDFLRLYKQWKTQDFDRRFTPTVNRMNSNRGYTLDNVEWVTNSQNCGLSSSVRKAKYKKAVYELLGVK